MNKEVVEKRRALLINTAFFALIVAVFYFLLKLFSGILLPFIAAFIVAALIQRPVYFLSKKTHIGRGPISAVFVLLLLGVFGLLVFWLGSGVVSRLKGFAENIAARLQNLPEFLAEIREWLLGVISVLPGGMRESLSGTVTRTIDKMISDGVSFSSISDLNINWSSLVSASAGTIKNTVVKIPSVLIGVVISLVASVFMTVEYRDIKAFVLRQFPEENRKKIVRAKRVAITTLKKMFKAYGLIMLITTTELLIGFYTMKAFKIFNSDYIPILSVVIAIIDIIPVLGTGTVLIPWAVYSFFTADIKMGVCLLIMYVVILVIRQIIEPKLVAGQVGLSPIVTIIAMYVGAKLLSVVGFFVVPFTVIVIKKFNDEGIIHLFKTADMPEETAVTEELADAVIEPDNEAKVTATE